MAQSFRFLYDQTRCMGCNACQMACKDKNDLEPGLFFRRVETIRYEEDGKVVYAHYSGACNHCQEAACVKACPVGAMVHMEDGSVRQAEGRCIGCGACTWACPYGAVSLSHKLGIARKCDLCIDLRRQGKAPACVDACPTHCLTFEEVGATDVGERAEDRKGTDAQGRGSDAGGRAERTGTEERASEEIEAGRAETDRVEDSRAERGRAEGSKAVDSRAETGAGKAAARRLYGEPRLPFLPDPAVTRPSLLVRKKEGILG